MDYIKPTYCNAARFQSVWTEFKRENRVDATTSVSSNIYSDSYCYFCAVNLETT
ncbi:hypothetical protein PILCRDRAFT_498750 [Piloderma croceum F 1598]|uniref:Uncharacterized protein n=1 Tax=Piloderma croceum (strain F 1598) TaxID=765440 RepID=A0A0C3FAM6_PILCF|nr:hypothetical protein PILCRDRAFT_498750 [Piloderma croceum F 1598]